MKTRIRVLAFSLMLAAMACQHKELESIISLEPVEMTFDAGFADEVLTRTQMEFPDATHFNILWNPGESINVFYGDAGNTPGSEFISQNESPSSSASFTGTINSFIGADENGVGYSFWGVYPYSASNRCDGSSVRVTLPSFQTAVAGNVDNNTLPMVAKASGLTLPFYNVWAVFRVKLTNTDIKSITLRGNNGEIMSGPVSVTMGSDGKPVWSAIAGEGKTYVTLKAPEGTTLQANVDYYIAFLPQTFSNGFTFSFHKSNGEFGSYKVTSNTTLERSKRYNLLNKDGGTNVNYFGYVDMGNGLKIATVNIGGNSATDQGEEFAWGETTTKSSYDWDNYFWGTESALTKYTTADGKTALDPEDDPATVICGEDWRTPTPEEWATLVNNYTPNYNVIGRVSFQSASDATKSISFYMPQTGYSYYWSREIGSSSSSAYAFYVGINKSGNPQVGRTPTRARNKGSYIRPIYTRVSVTGVTLDHSELELVSGQSATLTPIFTPANATKKGVIWESEDTYVATVDENGVVTAMPVTEERFTTISVRTVDGDYYADCDVWVYPMSVQMGNGYWATCNLGAESPEELGDMYAWGETETKDSDSWSTYKWMMNSQSAGKYITKYQFPDGNTSAIWYDDGVFIGDGWSVLRSADDVAKQKLGGFWHIPSRTQWLWLMDNCDWDYDDEKLGYWVTSRASGAVGNKIFLPAHNTKSYWSNVVDGYDATLASVMFIRTTGLGPQIAYQRRSFRNFIRPVYYQQSEGVEVALNKTAIRITETGNTETLTAIVSPSDALETSVVWSSSDPSIATVARNGTVTAVSNGTTTIIARAVADFTETATCTVSVGYPVTGVTLNKTAVNLITGNSIQLTATVLPANAANKAVTWSTSNSSVATVVDGLVTTVSPGSATITVTTVEGGFTATCAVKVDDIMGGLNGHEWINMGNGVKWARTNIGTSSTLETGSSFAWGETSPKSEYTVENYVFYAGAYNSFSKYNGSDNKTVLEPTDDAATVNWGSGWRTPTIEDWDWLKRNCDWRYDSINNVYVVTNSVPGYENYGIVIPIVEEPYVTYYWSANVSTSNYRQASAAEFSTNNYLYRSSVYRYNGYFVRPVCD